ncbi:MAG TPA: hypothetical protein VKZ50_03420 [bacterium]|nr:hypothetical protein [bacterium]
MTEDAGAPFVNPPPAACTPSNYVSAAMPLGSSTPPAAMPTAWQGPPMATSTPPTGPDNIYSMLGVTDPMATNFVYKNVMAPYPDAAGCHAFNNQGHQAVHDCLCDKCFSLMQQCDAVQGCQAIAKCAWDSGCDPSAGIMAANSCYPIAGTGCTAPINQYGTGSVSTGLAQQLGLCGKTNSCPSQ